MSDYIKAPVVGGQVVTDTSETYQTKKSKGDEMGKDAFLQLLVAQMQNQDPLKPADNSQMVAELAQFTTIEELQNLGSAMDNTSAFGLVGKNVIIEVGKSEDAATTTTVGGYVEYVQIVDGKAMLSVGGELYKYADLDMVVDDEFLEGILNGGQTKPEEGTGGETGETGGTGSEDTGTEEKEEV